MNEQVNIKLETVNKVLNYLATKPHNEVALLIAALSNEARSSIQLQNAKDEMPEEPVEAEETSKE